MSAPSAAQAVRKRLIKGSGLVLLGWISTTLLGLVVNGLLARLLPHRELGAYFLLFQMAFVGGTLSQLGLERAIVRVVSASVATGQAGRARRAVDLTFGLAVVGSLVLAAVFVIWLGQFLADHVYHSVLVSSGVVVAGGWIITMAFQSLFAETFRGFQRFWLATLFNGLLVDVFSVLVFGLLFIVHAHPSLRFVLVTSIGVTAGPLLVAGWLLRRRLASVEGPGRAGPGELLSIAWPLWVFNLSTFLVGTGVDVFVVGAFRGQSAIAFYGAAARLVFFVATPFTIVSQVVPPIIAELWARGQKRQLEQSLREVSTLAGLPAFLVLVVFLFLGGPILALVYGSPFFRKGASILAILSVARMVAVATGSSGSALQMTGYQKSLMVLTLGVGVCSVGGGILLVRSFGAMGVAVATASAQVLQNLGQLFLARWRLGIWTHAELSLRPLKALLVGG